MVAFFVGSGIARRDGGTVATMKTIQIMISTLALALTLSACDQQECEVTTMEADDKTWVTSCDWPTYAQAAVDQDIDDALAGGIFLEPSQDVVDGADCYPLSIYDGHMCVVTVDGINLIGRPEREMEYKEADCVDAQGWSIITDAGTESCWSVFDGVAVLVREG